MMNRDAKSQPAWTDVKDKLAAFDRTALLDLIHRLYAADNSNQAFLHARFGLGEDLLEPYWKPSLAGSGVRPEIICEWPWRQVLRNQ